MAVSGLLVDVQIMWDGVNWTSLGGDPQTITIARGRSDDLATVDMGTCTVRLTDTTGKYSIANTGGPFYGNIRAYRRVRVIFTYLGTPYTRFNGFLLDCQSNPDYGTQEATIHAGDIFALLALTKPVVAPMTNTTVKAAITNLLSLVPAASAFTFDAPRDGDNLPTFQADGSAAITSLIGDLLLTDRGLFYVRADGTIAYDTRHARFQGARATSQASISAGMQAIAPGLSAGYQKNRATVTRDGGTAQTYTDAASVTEMQVYADFNPITSPYLATEAQALSLATYLVLQRKDPVPTARNLALTWMESSVRLAMVQRDISDRITATNALTGVTGEYFIEHIEDVITNADNTFTSNWLLSKASTKAPFRIGRSGIGGPDVISY